MLSLLFFAVFVTYSCQPSAIRKSRMAERSTEVDSVLYYPAKEIKDPFLDSLKIDINAIYDK